MVQTPAVKIGETINRRRVEASLCLEDLAEGSRVSVFVPCPGGMVEAGTGSAIPPQRWAGSDIPQFTRGYRNPNTGNLPTIMPFMRSKRRLRGRSFFCQNDACAAAIDEPPPQRKWAGNTTFRFLSSLTSRSALRLYTASRSNSKNPTRSSGGSILAVAKSSLS